MMHGKTNTKYLKTPEKHLFYPLKAKLNPICHLVALLDAHHILHVSGIRANLRCVSILGDRLCGLVVRVSGYRYRGLGFDSRRYQIF